jgi:predicted GIY-YIG superfamily endonuclease
MGSIHTKHHRPWTLITCLAFNNKLTAVEFEKYLKSHAGRSFAQKKFW